MPTTRLVTRLVTTTASISSGAVLTLEGKTATTSEGLGVINELFDLLADTVATKNQHTDDEHDEIVRFLKRCTRRYGTVRGTMDAIGDRRRTHPLISREKANAWSSVMSVISSAVETQLKRHPSLKVHISRWLSDQGSPIEDRLKLYTGWLDAPFPDGTAPVAERVDEDEDPLDDSTISVDLGDEKALELYAMIIADKRPGLSPSDRRPTDEEAAIREELADSDNAFARLCVALSSHDFETADLLIRRFAGSIEGDYLHTLRGECAYGSGRFSDAVGHYRVALTHCTSHECALNLALALGRADIGTNEERTREALDVLTSLRDRQEAGDPSRVRTLVAIGSAHLHNPTGDRDANVLLAIEALETALETIERENDPHWWAEAHIQLGAAWQSRPTGKRVENIQRAITCFTRAEEIWSRDSHPQHWATIQNNLGHAWESLPTGHRAINLQRAIEYFDAALKARTELGHQMSVATIRNNLGNAWIKFPAGDHAENVTKGIEHHTAALEVWSRHGRRQEWAATQNNLGNAWALLPVSDETEREKNLRRAISCYKAALDVRTRASTPSEWAATQNNLGSALILLGGDTRAKPVREAIECFNKALEVRTRSAYPVDWAKTQANLGRAWERLADGDPVRNIDAAMNHFNNALSVFTESAYPHLHNHTVQSAEQARARLNRLGFG